MTSLGFEKAKHRPVRRPDVRVVVVCRLVQSSKYRLSPAADRFNIMEFVAIKRVVRIATATDE